MSKNLKRERPVAVMPNGIGIGTSDDEMITIDFFGTLDADGAPKELLGSYVFSFKRANSLAEQIKEAITDAATNQKSE
ncbi:hypothetical protein LJC22_05400 [Desulfosarcina sp. OttesenSCG-928-G10]|nr:hypothetical protein [Desulfosarcina sp. OttesenSCG-928-G10]